MVASQVFLESHVQLIHAGIAGGVGAIHVMLYAIERDSNIGQRSGGPLEFPGEVVPLVSGRHFAGDTGGYPISIGVAPYIKVAGGDVALRAENPSLVAIGLVAIEFQRLRVLRQLACRNRRHI